MRIAVAVLPLLAGAALRGEDEDGLRAPPGATTADGGGPELVEVPRAPCTEAAGTAPPSPGTTNEEDAAVSPGKVLVAVFGVNALSLLPFLSLSGLLAWSRMYERPFMVAMPRWECR